MAVLCAGVLWRTIRFPARFAASPKLIILTDQVNMKVGKTLASGIDTAEQATKSVGESRRASRAADQEALHWSI